MMYGGILFPALLRAQSLLRAQLVETEYMTEMSDEMADEMKLEMVSENLDVHFFYFYWPK